MILLLNAPTDAPLAACPLLAGLEARALAAGVAARVVHTGPLVLRTLGREFGDYLAFAQADTLAALPVPAADGLLRLAAEIGESLAGAAGATGTDAPPRRVLLTSAGPGTGTAGAFAEALRSHVDGAYEVVIVTGGSAGDETVEILQRCPDVDAVVTGDAGLEALFGVDAAAGSPAGSSAGADAGAPGGAEASACYDSFLAQFAAVGARGCRPWLPLAVGADGAGAVRELLALSARYRVLRFELGALDLADAAVTGFLAEVAGLRRDGLYGFEFRCSTGFDVTRDQAALLAGAGVTTVRIAVDAVRSAHESGVNTDQINARMIRSLRRLQDSGVDVRWLLAVDTHRRSELEWVRPRAVSHLAPPQGILALGEVVPGDGHADAMRVTSAWRAAHAPRKLTYGRGPGFVRLLDRRDDADSMTFINLAGAQSELYDACEDGATVTTLTEVFPRLPAESVGRFLDQLVGQDLMLRTCDGRYQTLALRRRLDERWTSAEQ